MFPPRRGIGSNIIFMYDRSGRRKHLQLGPIATSRLTAVDENRAARMVPSAVQRGYWRARPTFRPVRSVSAQDWTCQCPTSKGFDFFPSKLNNIPTATTTTQPTTLYQRKLISVRLLTTATEASPHSIPQNAPRPVARFVPIASANTPSMEP